VQLFFHSLGSLRQLHEFSNLHLHHTRRNIISLERGGEAIPGDRGPLWIGGTMMRPPNPSRSLQLMRCVLCLELFGQLKETKLLLHGVNPFIHFKRFHGLLKDRWFGVHDVLERAILIHSMVALVIPTAGVVSDVA